MGMKPYQMLVGAITLLGAGAVQAAAPPAAQQLCKQVQAASRAWASMDYAAIKSWPGPGFVHIDDRGRLMDKRTWLAWVRKRLARKHGIITRDILIRMLGTTAVVSYRDDIWSARRGYAKSAEHLIMTTVWHRYATHWKEVSYQTSVLFDRMHCKVGKQVHCTVQVTGPAPAVDGHAPPHRLPYVHVGPCRYEDISQG